MFLFLNILVKYELFVCVCVYVNVCVIGIHLYGNQGSTLCVVIWDASTLCFETSSLTRPGAYETILLANELPLPS